MERDSPARGYLLFLLTPESMGVAFFVSAKVYTTALCPSPQEKSLSEETHRLWGHVLPSSFFHQDTKTPQLKPKLMGISQNDQSKHGHGHKEKNGTAGGCRLEDAGTMSFSRVSPINMGKAVCRSGKLFRAALAFVSTLRLEVESKEKAIESDGW